MRVIVIGRKRHRVLVDDEDYERVAHLRLQIAAGGYVMHHNYPGRPQYLHHILVGNHKGKVVDHINGNKLDNRRKNLRVTTFSLNGVNRKQHHPRNKSGIRGVYFYPQDSKTNPWIAHICVNHEHIYLGCFPTKEAAMVARQAAELACYGENCPIPAEAR